VAVSKLGQNNIYKTINKRKTILLILMAVSLILGIAYTVSLGVAEISMAEVYGLLTSKLLGLDTKKYSTFVQGIVLRIRLPRVLLAVITGLALGCTGVIMQSILRNPLASPYTLGVSAGSAFGAGLAIVVGHVIIGSDIMAQYGSWVTIIGAFMMGTLTILIINFITSLKGGGTALLILAGVALSYLFSAGLSFFKYIAGHDELTELTVWLMGGLHRAEWIDILILTPIIIGGLIILLRMAWDINALNAGEEVAKNLGVDVQKLRKKGSILSALLTSCVIAFTGIIGFIGLVAPHIGRMIFGNDNRYLIIASGILGALILLGADTAARLIVDPAELPVGIITSIAGAPFFLYLLIKKRSDYWS